MEAARGGRRRKLYGEVIGAVKEDTTDRNSPPPEADDRPETVPGPPGWERTRTRSFLDRLERAEEAGSDPGDSLPEPSDREEFLSDVLTAAFGPPWPAAVPERFRNDPEALHGWARWRKRRAERERKRARVRLAARFRTPMHPNQWSAVVRTALRTLERRTRQWVRPEWREDGDAAWSGIGPAERRENALVRAGVGEGLRDLLSDDDDYARGDVRKAMCAFYDALVLAVEDGLSDPKVRESEAEMLEGRLRGKIADALERELTFEEWGEGEDDEGPGLTSIDDTADEESDTPLHDLLPDESVRVHEALMAQETLEAKVEAKIRRARRLLDVASSQQREVLLARLDPLVGRVLRDREGLIGDEARLAEAEAETWSAVAEACGTDTRGQAYQQYERLTDKLDEDA